MELYQFIVIVTGLVVYVWRAGEFKGKLLERLDHIEKLLDSKEKTEEVTRARLNAHGKLLEVHGEQIKETARRIEALEKA